ncbi:hypothetical protein [Paraburkholderia megapolitana]|uniref:Uncharacterized protein n=1 Tax=Paraburkholderia megapolitana TaxID=420953 RepID=A0A1I3UQI4_9BURK|nr:hypothetical protein [Paraburkholderia megapolitana]QDQ82312.1 hypothetical protein FNZ07_13540 [Paraburkholderia megapolitana]SFJ85135.1 hypothetical protein SAMN05192543_11231 [Paraburkholderia megapolitana]
MTTLTSSSSNAYNNVVLQAKRLKKHLKIPLHLARYVLAKGPYHCDDWDDLVSRLNTGNPGDHVRQLSSLPGCHVAVGYFTHNIDQIARAISQHLLTNTNLAGLYETVRAVFLMSDRSMSLTDMVPCLPTLEWESANLGADPYAVLYASAFINGVPFRVVATRVYLPRYFNFGAEVQCGSECAEPWGEKIKIMWSKPNAWYDAARTYLTAPEDDFDVELVLPNEVLNDKMKEHSQWFDRAMSLMHSRGEYRDDDDDQLIPYWGPGGTYAMFGFPSNLCDVNGRPAFEMSVARSAYWGSELIAVGDHPICFDWCKTFPKLSGSEYAEYAEHIRTSVFTHPETDLNALCPRHSSCLFFLRPATAFDIRQAMAVELRADAKEEVFVLKSDHPRVAEAVLGSVAEKRITVDRTPSTGVRHVLELDVSEHPELSSLSLTLEVNEGNKAEHAWNMVSMSIVMKEHTSRTLYLLLHPALFSLMHAVGKKVLVDAVSYGLVIRRPAGLASSLERLPKWTDKAPPSSPETVNMFDRATRPDPSLSLFDLFRRMRRTIYERDNY